MVSDPRRPANTQSPRLRWQSRFPCWKPAAATPASRGIVQSASRHSVAIDGTKCLQRQRDCTNVVLPIVVAIARIAEWAMFGLKRQGNCRRSRPGAGTQHPVQTNLAFVYLRLDYDIPRDQMPQLAFQQAKRVAPLRFETRSVSRFPRDWGRQRPYLIFNHRRDLELRLLGSGVAIATLSLRVLLTDHLVKENTYSSRRHRFPRGLGR